MSYSSGNKSDPGFQQLNELYNWVFDSEQSEYQNSGSLQISSFSNTNDSYFEHSYERFHQSRKPDVDASRSYQNSNTSYEEFDPTFKKLNDQFFWDDDSKVSESGGFRGHQISDDFSGDIFNSIFEKLNDLFSWVDDCKLFDVGGSGGQHICCNCEKVKRNDGNLHGNRGPRKKYFKPTEPCFGNDDETRNKFTESNEMISKDVDEINAMLRKLTCVPDNPESEEEDLYLRCRRDAINMMSAATKHLSEAKIAHLSGDHINAKRLSQQGRGEQIAAQRLHEKAAREILSVKNEKNGIMRLDLHCLHVPEAIQAVKERLHKIETQMGSKNSDEHGLGKLKRQRLEVITGRGKHSSGTPKLPGAVKSFLKKNDYKFDCSSNPGVIMVWPKICGS